MGIGMIAKLHAQRAGGVQGVGRVGIEIFAVEKERCGGGAVGVFFVESGKDGEDRFDRARWRVVERKGNEFSAWINRGNVHVRYVPKCAVCRGRRLGQGHGDLFEVGGKFGGKIRVWRGVFYEWKRAVGRERRVAVWRYALAGSEEK